MGLSISLIFFVNIKNKIIEIIFYSPVGLVNLNDVNSEKLVAKSRAYLMESSSAGEFRFHALTEPDVNLSIHPPLIVQPQ